MARQIFVRFGAGQRRREAPCNLISEAGAEPREELGNVLPSPYRQGVRLSLGLGVSNWVPLPSLAYLPKNVLDSTNHYCEGANSGSLLKSVSTGPQPQRIYVANIFTQSWKLLPPCPATFALDRVAFAPKLFMDSPSGPYKVIGFHLHDRHLSVSLIIYESKTDAWRIINVCFMDFLQLSQSVYLDGVLYMVPYHLSDLRAANMVRLLAVNVEEGTCEHFTFVSNAGLDPTRVSDASLIVWNAQLVMIQPNSATSVIVVKINLVSQELLEMSRGPPDSLKGDFEEGPPSCHGNYIFFRRTEHGRVAYNLLKNEWSLFQVPPR